MQPHVVQSIRLPRELWDEIKEQAEVTDRSFNRVVLHMLQAQIKQQKEEKQKIKKEVGA